MPTEADRSGHRSGDADKNTSLLYALWTLALTQSLGFYSGKATKTMKCVLFSAIMSASPAVQRLVTRVRARRGRKRKATRDRRRK